MNGSDAVSIFLRARLQDSVKTDLAGYSASNANAKAVISALVKDLNQVISGPSIHDKAHWDYRPGMNNNGGQEFTSVTKTHFDEHAWSRVEILADAGKGTARMAVAQPPGNKAVAVLDPRISLSVICPRFGGRPPIRFRASARSTSVRGGIKANCRC
jgi:hypothetical protein